MSFLHLTRTFNDNLKDIFIRFYATLLIIIILLFLSLHSNIAHNSYIFLTLHISHKFSVFHKTILFRIILFIIANIKKIAYSQYF